MALTREELARLVELQAARQGVDPALARAVAHQESGFDPAARSPKGALGVMQLMPGTAKDLGVDPLDVSQNIAGGVKYLAQLSQRYGGDRERTLAAYNAGPGAVEKFRGVPPFPETRGYVATILRTLGPAEAEAADLSSADATRLEALKAERARRAASAPVSTPADAAATVQGMRQRQAEPPSDLTVDIEKPSPPENWQAALQGIPPLDARAATDLLAARSPLPSAGEQARTLGAIAVPMVTGTGGAIAGGALGGPAGAFAGGVAGGVYGSRLNTQLGLTPPEAPLMDTVLGPVYPSDAINIGVPLAARALAPVAAKVGNALSSTLRPAAQRLVDLGERWGVRLSVGDITGRGIIPKTETLLESVPGVGAQGFRERGQQAIRQAGETYTAAQRQAMIDTPWRNLAQLQRAAGQQTARGTAARALLAEIDNAGDDWGRVIQASGKLNLFQDRLRAEQLYDRVERLAAPLGNVRVTQTLRAIDDAVADVQGAVLPSTEVQREVGGLLQRAREAIATVPTGPLPDTSYARMRRLRSDLGDMQRTATEPLTARYLGQVKSALENDLAAFTTGSGVPALQQAQRQADQFYRTRVVRYREGALARAIERDLPDEIYRKFVQQGKGDRATEFYGGLDARGQSAVRYGMAQEAIEAATSGGTDLFSPAKFAQSLRRAEEASGVFFQGQARWELNGLRHLMEHSKRFGQFAENPPTGNRLVQGGIIGGVLWNPALAAQLFGSAKGAQWLFMTRPGRNLLLAASDLQPGSSALTRHLDRALRSPALAPLVAGGQAGARAQGEPPPGVMPGGDTAP